MGLNQKIINRCHEKLSQLARDGERISYGELAEYLGVANQSVGRYLNEVYRAEMRSSGHDLTLLPHYSNNWFGKYNSHGLKEQSVVVDTDDIMQVKAYKNDLLALFSYWGGKPKGDLKNWLES